MKSVRGGGEAYKVQQWASWDCRLDLDGSGEGGASVFVVKAISRPLMTMWSPWMSFVWTFAEFFTEFVQRRQPKKNPQALSTIHCFTSFMEHYRDHLGVGGVVDWQSGWKT